jgi:ELP3 family radical SAM enzyme/protein acetyltransferase
MDLKQEFFINVYNTFVESIKYKDNIDYNDLLFNIVRRYFRENKKIFNKVPSKNELMELYEVLIQTKVLKRNSILDSLLMIKSVRSNSGVLPISIALNGNSSDDDIEGFSCAYDCSFCPNECGIARSYLSSEGTFIRGSLHNFDTIQQVWRRLCELETMGHTPDKLEIIALGGTWDCYPKSYREKFANHLFYACNTYPLMNNSVILTEWLKTRPYINNLPLPPVILQNMLLVRPIKNLQEEKDINTMKESCRIIGIVLETRPDRINRFTLLEKRRFGCTRIQLGIQHTDNDVLGLNNRGHPVEKSIRAIKLCRDACFKVDGHIMPDMPYTTLEKDYEMMRRIFLGKDMQLDYCKIYPCLDLPFTKARTWKEQGKWKPIAENNFKDFIDLLCYTLTIVPPWTRIARLQRDFPEASDKNQQLGYVSDNIRTNLHQLVDIEMKRRGLKCYDIRSREIKNTILTCKLKDKARLYVRIYRSNEGAEYFISVEIPRSNEKDEYNDNNFDDTYLLGLCRLRIPDENSCNLPYFKKNKEKIGLIRELHVYGMVVTDKNNDHSQHQGIGKFLLSVAENIAYKNNCKYTLIISGVGVRNYYKKLGYNLVNTEDEYMDKQLNKDNTKILSLFNKSYNINKINKTRFFIEGKVNKPLSLSHFNFFSILILALGLCFLLLLLPNLVF